VYRSAVAWGDYDRDGDLDVLLAGYSNAFGPIARLYRNANGVFTNINAGLEGVYYASAAWVDHDNDGDLDIFVAGQSNCCPISRIYRNQSGVFVDALASLQGMYQGSVTWGDYDNDGDMDLLMAGYQSCCGRSTRVYRNDGGSMIDVGSLGLDAVDQGCVAWGDYDNDGDLDVLMVGYANCCGRFARAYRNQSGSFTDIGAGSKACTTLALARGVTTTTMATSTS